MRQNRQLVIFVFVRVCATWSGNPPNMNDKRAHLPRLPTEPDKPDKTAPPRCGAPQRYYYLGAAVEVAYTIPSRMGVKTQPLFTLGLGSRTHRRGAPRRVHSTVWTSLSLLYRYSIPPHGHALCLPRLKPHASLPQPQHTQPIAFSVRYQRTLEHPGRSPCGWLRSSMRTIRCVCERVCV